MKNLKKLKNSAPDERTCVDDNECEVDGIGLCKTREVPGARHFFLKLK